jgi:chromatin remodeling complex protein RSC6
MRNALAVADLGPRADDVREVMLHYFAAFGKSTINATKDQEESQLRPRTSDLAGEKQQQQQDKQLQQDKKKDKKDKKNKEDKKQKAATKETKEKKEKKTKKSNKDQKVE